MAIIRSIEGYSGKAAFARVQLEDGDMIEYVPGDDEIRLVSSNNKPGVSAIFVNPPYTTVKWTDDTFSTVKCCEDDTFSEAQGFAAALAKKLYGGKNESSSHVKKFVAAHVRRKKAEKKKQEASHESP